MRVLQFNNIRRVRFCCVCTQAMGHPIRGMQQLRNATGLSCRLNHNISQCVAKQHMPCKTTATYIQFKCFPPLDHQTIAQLVLTVPKLHVRERGIYSPQKHVWSQDHCRNQKTIYIYIYIYICCAGVPAKCKRK